MDKKELAKLTGYSVSQLYARHREIERNGLTNPDGSYKPEAIGFLKNKKTYRGKKLRKRWMGHRWPADDLKIIQEACREAGISGSEIIRRGALNEAECILKEKRLTSQKKPGISILNNNTKKENKNDTSISA